MFISAIISQRSYSARIVDAARGSKIALLLSKAQVDELGRVLHKPKLERIHRWNDERISLYLRKLRSFTHPISLPGKAVLDSDATDSIFLDCADEGNADAIVSSDEHLLGLGAYKGILIITPKQCVEQFQL